MVSIKPGMSSLCDIAVADNLKHLIMNCPKLLNERNDMFYKITVEISLSFINQEDDIILDFLFRVALIIFPKTLTTNFHYKFLVLQAREKF